MKKYLMMSLAALAFASCNKLDFTPMSQAEIDQQKYETAFLNYVGGTIDENQDWGFGTSYTRGLAFTRTAYPNANQWAAQGYNVPDPLTAGQKARVQYYFQMVQYPGGTKDYGQIDFFMQQVYDGGDDPMPGKSPEQYLAANNSSYITSGEHMDHLTAGSDNEHIYNFNNGTCTTNYNVGNNGAALDTDQHSDEIMLMLKTKTDKFGYANSDASYVRTDRYRQVAGSVIDAYCDNNSAFQAWLSSKGITDDKVVDEWNRSFIGFDFDMIPDDYVFAGDKTWENGKITAITYSYFSIWLGDNTLVWNGTAYVEASTLGEVVDEGYGKRFYPYMPGTTNKVRMLDANTNQYCGTSEDWTDDKWEIDYRYLDENNVEQYGGKRTRVDYMLEALRAGKLPISSSNKTWVLIGGCADGYYSDWIVSFLPATSSTVTPSDDEIRIIAEDLSATSASDFDFNDVVIDVEFGTPAKVTLQAAGGTLPLRIRTDDGKIWEVHKLFGVWQGEEDFEEKLTSPKQLMVNTGAGPNKPAVVISDFSTNISDQSEANSKIHLEVWKNKTWQEMKAVKGEPASKLGVDKSFHWLGERVSIKGSCPKFVDWVNGTQPSYIKWW